MTTLATPSSKQRNEGNPFIRSLIEETRWNSDIRRRFERQWLLNYAFFLGIQHGAWDTLFGIPSQQRALQAGRVRYTGNQIAPRVLRRVSDLLLPPGWQVTAKSTDIQDALAARVGEDLLNHLYEANEISTEQGKMVFWGVVTGTGFMRFKFDTWAGKTMVFYLDPLSGKPLPPEMLTSEIKRTISDLGYVKRITEGEITVEAISPFQVYLPPVGQGERRSWMAQVSLIPLDQIYDQYGSTTGYVVENASGGGRKAIWMETLTKLQGAVGPFGGWVIGPDDRDLVWVRELWYRACERYPEGRYVVEANGVTIRDSGNPVLELGFNFPFVQFNYIQTGNRVWGKSMVEDMIWPQRTYNETHEIRQENMKLMGRPMWLEPKGCEAHITNRPGHIVKYNPQKGVPQPVKLQTIDQAVEVQANRSLQDMQDISAQQDVTQAKVPPNLRSGVAIQLLQEGDQKVLSTPVQQLVNAMKEAGRKLLKFVVTYWDDGKVVRLWGKDQVLDIQPFRELANRDAFDVIIPPTSMLPRSKAAQTQNLLEAAQAGLIDYQNPVTRKRVLETLELGNMDAMLKQQLQDVRRAEMENEIFMVKGPQDGAWPAVEPFDDHQIHLMIHNGGRKSDLYEFLPAEAKLAYDEHCKVHEEAFQQIMEQQMQMAEAMKGMPGEKGQPSRPREVPRQ